MKSKFSASQAYGLDKSRFHFFDGTFELVLGLASNLLGWMPWLWDVSEGLVSKAGLGDWGGDIPTSLTFVILAMFLQVSFDVPYMMSSTRRHSCTRRTAAYLMATIILDSFVKCPCSLAIDASPRVLLNLPSAFAVRLVIGSPRGLQVQSLQYKRSKHL